MAEEKPKKNEMETDLAGHRLHKKELQPPLAQIGMTHSSWKDHRMPEMLWAVLVISGVERDEALKFFRYVAKFVEANHEYLDVTHSGIGKLTVEQRKAILAHMLGFSPKIKQVLRALKLFNDLPGYAEWSEVLDEPVPDEDWRALADALVKVFDHQSQESTDCRWVKLLCLIVGGKIKFHTRMAESVQEILDYPNRGDMHKVRPTIRSAEIGPANIDGAADFSWANAFWKAGFERTSCLPESKFDQVPEADLEVETDRLAKHYLPESVKTRNGLITHFIMTAETSGVDPKHEAVFGLALYAATLFAELILYRLSLSLTGRLTFRSLVEVYITLAYLLKKGDGDTWKSYRGHGVGQAKLVYLKLQELDDKPPAIDERAMRLIANEDAWQEFVTINLGHFDESSLRRMSDEAGLKEVYDKYYNWSSGYVHGSWAGVREGVFEVCVNPLHRYHRHPTINFPLFPSVMVDATNIMNRVLELVDKTYPEFKERVIPPPKPEATATPQEAPEGQM